MRFLLFPVDLLSSHPPFLAPNVGFHFFSSFLRARSATDRFERRIRVAERPAENWFLGRGSKSGQHEMLVVFRRLTRKVVLEYSPHRSCATVFFYIGLERTDNVRGMCVSLRRITFSRDFHGLTIRHENI